MDHGQVVDTVHEGGEGDLHHTVQSVGSRQVCADNHTVQSVGSRRVCADNHVEMSMESNRL